MHQTIVNVVGSSIVLAMGAMNAGVAQPAATESSRFETISFETADGGLVYGNRYGDGAHAVVLAHGAIFNKESWHELASQLAAEGFSTLAIDFRGYGESRPGRSRGALYEDVLAAVRYLRAEGAERVAVLGGSMGGGAAGTAAARAEPGEIDDLILLAAVAADAPERMQGRKLFIVSRGDGLRRTVERQFESAPGPKELVILEGNAHAQHIFRTDRGIELTDTILAWLARAPRAQ
jgi:pimeloyl-ACP methyl ester carboxylesterase